MLKKHQKNKAIYKMYMPYLVCVVAFFTFSLSGSALAKKEGDISFRAPLPRLLDEAAANNSQGRRLLSHWRFDRALREHDPRKGRELLRLAAEDGLPEAQHRLAMIYLTGDGVAANLVIARAWLSRAAEAGDPFSQYSLGLLFLQGSGGKLDTLQGVEWLVRAAETGDDALRHRINLRLRTLAVEPEPKLPLTPPPPLAEEVAGLPLDGLWRLTTFP